MSAFTGVNASIKFGAIGDLNSITALPVLIDCTGWSVEASADLKSYASCSTNGAEVNLKGIVRGGGSLSGYVDDGGTGDSIWDFITPGDICALHLYERAAWGHRVASIIENVSEQVQIEGADLVSWTANYKANNINFTLFNVALP